VPAAGQAAKPLETQRFKVSVKGVQTTAWSYDAPGGGLCRPSVSGEGTEVVRFATAKPQTIVATRFSPTYVLFGDAEDPGELVARAKVTRHMMSVEGPLDPTCVDKRGGGGIGTPDCGTKHAALSLTLSYESFGRPRGVKLRSNTARTPDPFLRCPTGGVSFPTLLDRTTNGTSITSDWPVRDVMDRGVGKTIVIGRGRTVAEDATSRKETTIRWEVTLRRIGKTRAAAAQTPAEPVCTVKAKRSYRLAEAKRGMPVHVTCDRATAVFAAVDLAADGEASRLINPRAHPHAHGWSSPRTVEAGRRARLRVPLQPYAARAVEQAGGSRVIFGLGIKHGDGHFHNNPNPGGSVRSRVTTN
jgi:hypothetical protein